MNDITPQQKRALKSQLHFLRPSVIVGKEGLTDSILQEINRALNDQELIKIRLSEADRNTRENMTNIICKNSKSALIQSIGKVIAIYKKIPKKALE